jgi:quercetin dioxygenase-like cupin family protein
MPSKPKAEILCRDLATALDFYTNELEFRIDLIFPADAPRVMELSGHGINVRLEQDGDRRKDEWGTGRAGMEYRDLIPDRMGGQMIASHIRIQHGGPVPDYVHHHGVSSQMIYCFKGWVKVVYEDQGPPFTMQAGDCVLQPPHIRHRVLECSDNMEVIEVSSPAEHETFVDHDMRLPTGSVDSNRDFAGQRFVIHVLADASWRPATCEGFEARDTGIEAATNGLVAVQVLRSLGTRKTMHERRDNSMSFNFVLQGSLIAEHKRIQPRALMPGDAFVVPAGTELILSNIQEDTELLRLVSSVTA